MLRQRKRAIAAFPQRNKDMPRARCNRLPLTAVLEGQAEPDQSATAPVLAKAAAPPACRQLVRCSARYHYDGRGPCGIQRESLSFPQSPQDQGSRSNQVDCWSVRDFEPISGDLAHPLSLPICRFVCERFRASRRACSAMEALHSANRLADERQRHAPYRRSAEKRLLPSCSRTGAGSKHARPRLGMASGSRPCMVDRLQEGPACRCVVAPARDSTRVHHL